jgi:predicted HicB family RNase H-like nuclease
MQLIRPLPHATSPQWCYDGAMDEIRLTVRLPRELHEHIRALADEDRRSLNSELIMLLELAVDIEEGGGR